MFSRGMDFWWREAAWLWQNAEMSSGRQVRPPQVAFGVAGWSYPDWRGIVYAPREKEPLRYLADFVDMLEINSTFYRVPEARHAQAWVAQVRHRPGFFFSAKLYRGITHEGQFDAAQNQAFVAGLKPLAEAGRFRFLLAQFRYDFEDAPAARDLLARIHGTFGGLAENLVLELRHRSWEAPDAMQFLQNLPVLVASLDYPVAQDSYQADADFGEHAYLRLHGRNRKAWFDKLAGRDETYNYNYAPGELKEIAARAAKLARNRKSLTVVANNHYRGQALANLLELKARVTGQPVLAPASLLAAFPGLRPHAQCPPREQELFA